MTDSEKELRRLAEENSWLNPWRWAREVTPSRVLALLDRIEALEKQVAKNELETTLGPALDIIREPLIELGSTFPGGGLLGIAEGIREVVAKAERKGAEEMRKKCVEIAQAEERLAREQSEKESAAKYGRFDYWDGRRAVCRQLAKWTGDLPLPGDAP